MKLGLTNLTKLFHLTCREADIKFLGTFWLILLTNQQIKNKRQFLKKIFL